MKKYIVLILNILLISTVSFSQVVNQFSVHKLNPNSKFCDSITLIFADSSINATTYAWYYIDLINNDTVKNFQPVDTHTLVSGRYKIEHEINLGNIPPNIKDISINVNKKPVANFIDSALSYTGYFSRVFIDKSIKDLVNYPSYTYILDYDDGTSITDTTISFLKKYETAGTYTVTMIISDDSTCADTASIAITLTDSSSIKYIPNVFTPNDDDDINRLFIIEGNGNTNLIFEVYNRSGALVYRSKSPIVSWDGKTLSGSDAPTGVYYYILTSENNHYEVIKDVIYLFR